MVFNYYLGIPELTKAYSLFAEATENSTHFLVYQPQSIDHSKLKPVRRLHAFDADSFLRKRYWRVTDAEVARDFGLSCNK